MIEIADADRQRLVIPHAPIVEPQQIIPTAHQIEFIHLSVGQEMEHKTGKSISFIRKRHLESGTMMRKARMPISVESKSAILAPSSHLVFGKRSHNRDLPLREIFQVAD
jgi:hypothetical protein